MAVYFAALIIALITAVLAALGRVLGIGSSTPASVAREVLSVVINPLIALGTMTPLAAVLREDTAAESAESKIPSSLPAVPVAARSEAEPFFRKLAQEMPRVAGDLREDAPAPEPVIPPSRGRHARPDTSGAQIHATDDQINTMSELDVAA